MCLGPLVLIRPEYKDDYPLLQHELQHSRQFYRTFGLAGLAYLFDRYRYRMEVEAFGVQLAHTPKERKDNALRLFVRYLQTNYRLKSRPAGVIRQDLIWAQSVFLEDLHDTANI